MKVVKKSGKYLKSIFAIALSFAMIAATLPVQNVDVYADTRKPEVVTQLNYEELGLSQDYVGYYAIASAEQLQWFAGLVNGDSSVCIGDVKQNTAADGVLLEDITVNENLFSEKISVATDGAINVNEGQNVVEWMPIGNGYNQYTGTFDGNGYSISGLYYNDSNENYIGLFGFITGQIKNIEVKDSYFCGYKYIGGISGYNDGGTLINCRNSAMVYGDNTEIGGVCGYSVSGNIISCCNTGNVIAYRGHVGGVCGSLYYGEIKNCYNSANVKGKIRDAIGGVCGFCFEGSITTSYNTGNVVGNKQSYPDVGGVCGDTTNGNVTNCYYVENCAKVIDGDICIIKNGIGSQDTDVVGNADAKTLAEFQSGEIAYLLQETQKIDGGDDGSWSWGQNIGTDAYPVLSKENEQTIYCFDLTWADKTKECRYINKNDISQVLINTPGMKWVYNGNQTMGNDGEDYKNGIEIIGRSVALREQSVPIILDDTLDRTFEYKTGDEITPVKLVDFVSNPAVVLDVSKCALKEGYSLPQGLTLSEDGMISGTCSQVCENKDVIFIMTAGNGETAELVLNYTVLEDTITSLEGSIIAKGFYGQNLSCFQVMLEEGSTVQTAAGTVVSGCWVFAESQKGVSSVDIYPQINGTVTYTAVFCPSNDKFNSLEVDIVPDTQLMVLPDNVMANTGSENLGQNGWYVGDVTLLAPEGYYISDVFELDDEVWKNSLIIRSEWNDNFTYYLRSKEHGGISGSLNVFVKKDSILPNINLTGKGTVLETSEDIAVYQDEVFINVVAEDTNLQVDSILYSINGNEEIAIANNGVIHIDEEGEFTIIVSAKDLAGNNALEKIKIKIVKDMVPEQTAQPSTNPSSSMKPGESTTPDSSMKPSESTTPGSSVKPSGSTTPGSSMKPSESTTPGSSMKPSGSTNPGSSMKPSGSTTPGSSMKPSGSTTPDSSMKPSGSTTPGSSTPPTEPVPSKPEVVLKGDVDQDKEVTLTDAQLALKAALKIIILTDERSYKAADVDGNQMIDLQDAQRILKAALKIEIL